MLDITWETFVQGDPLATTLRVKVMTVRGLSITDRVTAGKEEAEDTEHVGVEAAGFEKQDGVAIEISSPLAAVRPPPPAFHVQQHDTQPGTRPVHLHV